MEPTKKPLLKNTREMRISSICAVKFCKSNSLTAGVSLFRFPKETERCKRWARLCGCEYLLRKRQELYSSEYRICSLHFDEKLIIPKSETRIRPRLLYSAVPTLNLSTGMSIESLVAIVNKDHDYYITDCKGDEPDPLALPSDQCTTAPLPQIALLLVNKPPPKSGTDVSTQTSKLLSKKIPQMETMRKKVHYLQNQIRVLKTKVAAYKAKQSTASITESATLSDFKQLCDKFLPPNCGKFAKLQADLYKNGPRQLNIIKYM